MTANLLILGTLCCDPHVYTNLHPLPPTPLFHSHTHTLPLSLLDPYTITSSFSLAHNTHKHTQTHTHTHPCAHEHTRFDTCFRSTLETFGLFAKFWTINLFFQRKKRKPKKFKPENFFSNGCSFSLRCPC